MSEDRRNVLPTVIHNWNQFWFNPADSKLVCGLRIAIGLFILIWLFSFSSDLARWYGPDGLAQDSAVDSILEAQPQSEDVVSFRWSLFRLTQSPRYLSTIHLIAFTAAATFTLGLASTVSGLVLLLLLISYVHRAPMLFSQTETVLTAALTYLCIAACGQHYSLDAYFRKRNGRKSWTRPKIRTNIAIRLLQVHLTIIYLYSFLSKLDGEVWWQGEAVWWMLIQPESSFIDLTVLGQHELVLNLWTHMILIVELLMATCIWYRPFRVPLIVLSSLVWLSLTPISGFASYCLLMLVLNFVFLFRPNSADQNEPENSNEPHALQPSV